MKFCLVLRGKHFEKNNVDYQKSVSNYKEFILNPLLENGHEVDVFILTYKTEFLSNLIKDYNPKHQIILDNYNELGNFNNALRQTNFFILSSSVLERNINNYDVIINTRFDLFFKVKITEMNIDYSKINIAFKHSSGNCDDNIFIFPISLLGTLNDGFLQIKNFKKIIHEICHYLPNDKINYMIDLSFGDYFVKQYNYFNIMRNYGIQT
jgi:hypothetical protein